MKITLKAEWEDSIYSTKKFVQEFEKIQDEYFERLFKKLKKDGLPEEFKDWLFDFVYNEHNEEKEFGDFLADHGRATILVRCYRCGWKGTDEETQHGDTIYCPHCPEHKDMHASLSAYKVELNT